jgi:hypothetical protein
MLATNSANSIIHHPSPFTNAVSRTHQTVTYALQGGTILHSSTTWYPNKRKANHVYFKLIANDTAGAREESWTSLDDSTSAHKKVRM